MLYEAIRQWLALRAYTHPKYVTLIGSARVGYSFDPAKYGVLFGPSSDLDFAVVSPRLFESLADDFFRWEHEYSAGNATPRGPKEKANWEMNSVRLPENINNGFVDAYKIPCWVRYPTAQKVKNLEWLLHSKISLTPGAPSCSKASIRVYKEWASLLKQMRINFRSTFAKAVAI